MSDFLDDAAPWAERTARVCEVWSEGERSLRDHFLAANPDLSDRHAFTETIDSYLNAHPQLCDYWQGYVDDKRSTPSPLVDRRGPTTAWMTTNGRLLYNRAFDSQVSACSHFLWMESNWVLHRIRVWMSEVPAAELADLAGNASKEEFDSGLEQFRSAHGLQHNDAIDVVALVAAQQFLDGVLSFAEGDQLLNLLWVRITDDLVEQGSDSPMPELAYAIFQAFDEGEYHHGDGEDPVTTYTLPALREIITELGA